MHPSDADWYIGFGDDVNTANEQVTYLQHWDGDNTGYVEEEERDSGGGIARVVMQQITPIK